MTPAQRADLRETLEEARIIVNAVARDGILIEHERHAWHSSATLLLIDRGLTLLDALDAAEGTASATARPVPISQSDPSQGTARDLREVGPEAPPPDPAEIAAVRARQRELIGGGFTWDTGRDLIHHEHEMEKHRRDVATLLAAYDAVVRERDRAVETLRKVRAQQKEDYARADAAEARADQNYRMSVVRADEAHAAQDEARRLQEALAYAQAALAADLAPAPAPPAP